MVPFLGVYFLAYLDISLLSTCFTVTRAKKITADNEVLLCFFLTETFGDFHSLISRTSQCTHSFSLYPPLSFFSLFSFSPFPSFISLPYYFLGVVVHCCRPTFNCLFCTALRLALRESIFHFLYRQILGISSLLFPMYKCQLHFRKPHYYINSCLDCLNLVSYSYSPSAVPCSYFYRVTLAFIKA